MRWLKLLFSFALISVAFNNCVPGFAPSNDSVSPINLPAELASSDSSTEVKVPITSDSDSSRRGAEQCPVGTCKALGSTQVLILTTETHVRVQSGEAKQLYRNSNSLNINLLVSKGGAVEDLIGGTKKKVFFEGSAKEYSLGKSGSTFKIKDSCGVVSTFAIGSDLSIKFIFSDGVQEFSMISGTNSFRYVYQGGRIELGPDEFMGIGYNYLDSSENSKTLFEEFCETEKARTCAELCEQIAKENHSPILSQRPVSENSYRCDIRGANVYFEFPKECTATYRPSCEVGSCKTIEAQTRYFVPASDTSARVLSGKSQEIFGYNRGDVNVVVHKGAVAKYGDQPVINKRMYFEGDAKDYSFNVSGNVFAIKDSCGALSQLTVGQDLKVKLIFKDGTQELLLVPGTNGNFRFVYQGVPRLFVALSSNEFFPAGTNYLETSVTSKPHFADSCFE